MEVGRRLGTVNTLDAREVSVVYEASENLESLKTGSRLELCSPKVAISFPCKATGSEGGCDRLSSSPPLPAWGETSVEYSDVSDILIGSGDVVGCGGIWSKLGGTMQASVDQLEIMIGRQEPGRPYSLPEPNVYVGIV